MVITRLAGGLGNQLFQYAAARALSDKLKVPLKLDLSYYINNRARKFNLHYFLLNEDISGSYKNDFPTDFYHYKEPHFNFDKCFYQISYKDIYLSGFWQSEKYFRVIEPILKTELQIRNYFIKDLTVKGDTLQQEESVCVHIRRGDYQKGQTLQTHGFIDGNYYQAAIRTLSGCKENLKFYFFSDDIKWVKDNITLNHSFEYVSETLTKLDIHDFFLMTKCKHHIIANSTFSWWAAWLSESDNKFVIAPKNWLNGERYDTSDVIPVKWYSI